MAQRSRIPKYDGVGDFEEFMTEFLYEGELYGMDEAAQARTIRLCLKGKALQIYMDLDETKKGSIKEIEKALREGCIKAPETYLSEF